MSSQNKESQDQLIVLEKTTKRQLARFIILNVVNSIHAIMYQCIPFIFFHPRLICQQPNSSQYEFCTEEDACNSHRKFKFYINDYPQINSISMQLNFFCQDNYLEQQMQMIQVLGLLLSQILLFIFPIPFDKMYRVMTVSTIILGAVLFCVQYFQNFIGISLTLSLWCFLRSIFYGLIYVYCKACFPGKVSQLSTVILSITFALSPLAYIGFVWFYGHWLTTLYICGCIYLALGVLQIVFDDKKDIYYQIEVQKERVSFKLFKERFSTLYHNRTYLFNSFIFAIGLAVINISLLGCILTLNKLEGNLYMNQLYLCIINLIFNVISLYLVIKKNEKSILAKSYFIVGVLFLLTLLQKINICQSSDCEFYYITALTTFPVILAMGILQIVHVFLFNILNKILPLSLNQMIMSIANLFSSICMDVIPYYDAYMESVGYYKYLGFGIFNVVLCFLSASFRMVEPDSKNFLTKSLEQIDKQDLSTQIQSKEFVLNIRNSNEV